METYYCESLLFAAPHWISSEENDTEGVVRSASWLETRDAILLSFGATAEEGRACMLW